MTAAIDDFINQAKAIDLSRALELTGAIVKGSGNEKVGPCPVCGGRDRFSVNAKKGLWFCRQADRGGDALALIAYKNGYDLARRSGLLAACSDLLGQPMPDGGDIETDDDRAARLARNAATEAKRAKDRAKDRAKAEKQNNEFRQREIDQARGIYFAAGNILGTDGEIYLIERAGILSGLPEAIADNIHFSAALTYWHGADDMGRPRALFSGPAMVAPFVTLDGRVVGCHQTWIDLSNRPKCRPIIRDDDGALLPTKKMRGRKKGGLIPVYGEMLETRWVVGEGIETVLAIAEAEQYRPGTFYAAAGDIGNLAGQADPASAFYHPTLTKAGARGRLRPVKIQGPKPAIDQDPADAFQVAEHVGQLVILADGDSEELFTASAMARAETRLSRPGLKIKILWPEAGEDFAQAANAARDVKRAIS